MLNLAQENWDAAADRIARAEGPIAWAWMGVHDRGEWHHLVLTVRGCMAVPHRKLRYSKFVFETEELTPRTAAKRFREGVVRMSRTTELPFRVEGDASVWWHTTEASGMHLTRGEWPRYVARFSRSLPNLNIPDRNDPLTARGQPYYPNVMTAAAELLYGVQPAHLGNDLSPNVTVVLPDRRARIRDIRFVEGSTVVHVERGRPADDLQLRAAWREEPEDIPWRSSELPIAAGEITVATEGIPAHMSIAVADRSGAVLDRREWDPARPDRPKDVTVSSEQIQRWITEGESTTLECKQELESDSVKRSLAETVAAFANGAGGVILIGVTNDYRIVGYEPQFSVSDQVSGLIDALVDEPPSVQIESVTVEGAVIHVVRVEASEPASRPHMVNGRPYYRANARTRVAFPSEVRRMTREDRPVTRLGVWG